MTGYSRARFGPAWADTDRNGCDTRNDILRRDLTQPTIKAATRGCVVVSGNLADPYTALAVHFVRGGASEIDVDHVVALGNAWRSGAITWPAGKSMAFANDTLNLLAVDATANRQKGDADAASWLPANTNYRCAYVARQVAVKAKYRLSVTAAEHAAIAATLSNCPSQAAPVGALPTVAPGSASPPTPPSTPAGTATSAASTTDPRFTTCAQAAAAGYGPYHKSEDPEYAWYRDSDHDGVVCE